jgi:hypothetical protein
MEIVTIINSSASIDGLAVPEGGAIEAIVQQK